ncbi:hypothetical protein MASR1M45_28690 [Candidatus Kapaibacterium sp.]
MEKHRIYSARTRKPYSKELSISPGILRANANGRKPSIKDIDSAQILAIDIDNDIKSYNNVTKKYDKRIKSKEEGYITYQEALIDQFVMENALFVYTTPSHQELFNRFRIVFVIEQFINNAEVYRNAITPLIERLGGDKSCSNIDRLFYGNSNCRLEYFGNILNQDFVINNQLML